MKGERICTCRASFCCLCLHLSSEDVLQELQRRGGSLHALPWEKLCPLPETILRGEDRDRLQWHQSANLPQTSTSCETAEKRVAISSRPQGICSVRVRFASFYRTSCGWRYLWMGSVFPHYVIGLFISLTPEEISACCLIYSTTNVFNQAGLAWIYTSHARTSTRWALCCLIHEYLSLHVKCLVSHSRGKYYFVNQRRVTRWCKNRSSTACGFIQGQQWRNALEEQM